MSFTKHTLLCKYLLFGFVLFFALAGELPGQMLVGGPNHAPEEVKAGAVNEGSVSGDVNVYTGTYDLTHTLGTVSGINGLSFTLTASYSSVVNTGTLAPSFKGFPMGEGWSLNLPSISCQVEDYEKYSRRQGEELSSSGYKKMFYLKNEISVEKANFFMNVNYSIPGVGSGKLVYIYSKGEDHFFSPNVFESPIIAVLNSGRWEITAPNGDRYEFVGTPSLRRNGNLRTHKYRVNPRPVSYDTMDVGGNQVIVTVQPEGHHYNNYSSDQGNNIKPREVIAEWFCTRITNPFSSGDAIFFEGEPYGKALDQFGLWRQDAIKELPFTSAYSGIPQYHQGYLLRRLRSGTEELELNYERIVPDSPESGGGDIEDVDIMYARQAIYNSGDEAESDWKRFKHVGASTPSNRSESSFYNGSKNTNPYLRQTTGNVTYNVESPGGVAGDGFKIGFEHGYLESPALPTVANGEFLELEFSVLNKFRPLLLDVNVLAGDDISFSTGVIDAAVYAAHRGVGMQNTFQSPLKFYSRNIPVASTFRYGISPQAIGTDNKMFIQIGPANSDNRFGEDLTSPTDSGHTYTGSPNEPVTILSYFNAWGGSELITYGWIGQNDGFAPDESQNFGLPIYPAATIPSNFGIGLPWHSMLHFYNEEIGIPFHTQNSRLFGKQTAGHFNFLQPFWWRSFKTSWDNVPTAANENVFLTDVKVYRYFKKKIALTSVKKYVKGVLGSNENPTAENLDQQSKNEISNVRLQYSVEEDAYRVSLPHGGGEATNSTLYTLLLRTIVNVPLEESVPKLFTSTELKHPTTYFTYSKLLEESGGGILSPNWGEESIGGVWDGPGVSNYLMANLPNSYVIDGYVGPLGNRKTIEYKSTGEGGSYGFMTRNNSFMKGNSADNYQTGASSGGQFQDNFAAKFIALVDRIEFWDKDEKLAFKYDYADGYQASSLRTTPHDNLNEDAVWNTDTPGFMSMKKTGPFQASSNHVDNAPFTEYEHYVDPILKGKLKSVKSYDKYGELVSSTQNDYSYSMAFEPGVTRMNSDRGYSADYAEYHSARPASPINRFSNSDFAQYVFATTGRNEEPFDNADRPLLPRIGGMELYSPWTPVRNNNSGITTEDTYGTNNKMATESSFFVQLNSSTSTDYMYCSEDEVFGITTTTEYDYYSAEYDGTFDAGVFGAIGPQVGENGRLRVVPSFLPAIKTTTNSHSPISTTEQYFYHWDLKNLPGYLGGNGINGQDYGLLSKLSGTNQGARPVRNLTYETRTTTGGVTQSKFNKYTSDVKFEYQDYQHFESELTIVCPSGEGVDSGGGPLDCEDNSGGNADCPNDNGCYLTGSANGDTPIGYCRQAAYPRMVCPCSLEGGVGAPEVGEIPFGNDEDPLNFQGNGAAFSFKNFGFVDGLGDGPQPSSIPSPEDQNIPVLKAVYVQVQEGGGAGANVSFSGGLENPDFHVPVVKTHELTLRTPYNLPVETRDVKGLKTHYDYAPIKVLHYEECVRNQYLFRAQTAFSAAAGLPVAITVGEGNNALVTTYEYDERRTLTSMTDPNNIVSTYSYDDFRRLEFSYRNGEPLSHNVYSNFIFTPQTYNIENYQYSLGEVLNNRVSSTAYIGNGGENTTTQYLDHLGRQSGQEVVYTGGTGSAGGHITGAPAYDIFGRAIAVKDVGASDPFLPSGAGSDPGVANSEYAAAPRGQVLKSARAGLSLDGNAYKTIETCIASDGDLREVIRSTGNTLALDFLPGGTTIKKRVIDEDGKTYESYSDGAGLGIATVSYEEGVPYAATVNQYDGRGNLVNSINPKKQITSYQYNYLGQPFEIISPDAGTTKIAYNVEGGVLSTVNGNGKQTSFKFDDFGRQIEQIDGVSPGVFSNEGLPWVNSLTDPWSYNITFGSGTKPKLEKVWQYNKLTQPSEFTDDLPGNFSSSNTLGRIAATFSYDDEYKPVHGTTFKYNEDGFIYEEASVFSNSKEEYVDYTVNYGDFLLNGSAETVSVDVSNDGVDFTHHFAYDGLGRLTRVSLSVPDQEIANQKYAEYSYNSDNTQLSATTYFSPGGEVMGIANKYDVANRLTSMSSPLYTENIIYDKGNEGYFNGNIFSVESIYGIAPYLSSPSTMGESSTYKYTYDGLNRLTKASLELGGNIFQHVENVAGNLDDFGAVEYGYDKVGNLESILRGEFDEELGQIGKIASAMSFPDQNNQLESVKQSGLGISSPFTFMYGHDGAGSLVSDGRTGKSVSYTRGTYPLTSGGDKFVYDVNDARIHKKGEKNEFYLRNGAGQELAIIDLDELTATWYAFGLTRFAEIGTSVGDCGEVPCRPEPPVANSRVNNYDAIALSNAQGTNINQISYPVTLFRLQLPSDQDVYLLGSELSGLGGQYNILQQILINSEEDILVVENITTEVTKEISFGDFLTGRLNQFNDLLVNGFHVCREECQEDVFACSDEILEQQKQDIKLLRNNRFTNDGTTLFTIVRIRLCNGDELYADQAQLENISGAFLVLQEINVDPADFTGINFEIGTSSGVITTPKKIGKYLYNSSIELSLDGYSPCFTIEPCAEENPVCANGQGPDYGAIRDIFNANNVIFYPAKLRRVRLCDGTEVHLLADELSSLGSAINYKVLQEVVFLTSSIRVSVYKGSSSSSLNTLEEIISLRLTDNDYRISDYPECKPKGCESPNCTEEQSVGQRADLQEIFENPEQRNSEVSFPVTLEHVFTCDEKEYWLTSQESSLIQGLTFSGRSVKLSSSTSTVAIQLNSGEYKNVRFGEYIYLSQDLSFISVNGIVGCSTDPLADCQSSLVSGDCNETNAGQQEAALRALFSFNEPCTSKPEELNLVELCNGRIIYLSDDELSLIPNRISVLSRTTLTSGEDYSVTFRGSLATLSVGEVYCERFNGISLIGSPSCSIVTTEEVVSCKINVGVSELYVSAHSDSPQVNVSANIVVDEICADGSSVHKVDTLSESYYARTSFNEKIFSPGNVNHYVEFETLRIREVLSDEVLIITFAPERLEFGFPGILSNLGISEEELTLLYHLQQNPNSSSAHAKYTDVIRRIVNYCINAHAGGAEFNSDIDLRFRHDNGGYYEILVWAGFFHRPTVPTYTIVPCRDAVVVNIHVKQTRPKQQSLFPVLEVYNNSRLFPFSCKQGLGENGFINAEKNKVNRCLDDSRLTECENNLYYSFDESQSSCLADIVLPFSVVPTVTAYWFLENNVVQTDLTQLINVSQTTSMEIATACERKITTEELSCNNEEPVVICLSGNCGGDSCNPVMASQKCSPENLEILAVQLERLNETFNSISSGVSESINSTSVVYPTQILEITFCNGFTRYLLPHEMVELSVNYRITERIAVASNTARILIDDGSQSAGNLSDFIIKRKNNAKTKAQIFPVFEDPAPGLDPVTGEPENSALVEVKSPLSFYLFDHLGNTRVTFRADAADAISITYAADYYPYGKVLRQYRECNQNRYLSTHHERDKDTGYDNRGARLYDSEIGRFLGVDPLADQFAPWSPYNYVLGNPIRLTDPDGRSSEDCCGGGPTIADEIIPSLVAAGKQLTHSISRNAQIIFGGKKPEDIPYRTYSTEWNGERSVVVYTESRAEPSTASRVFDNTTSGIVLAGAVPSSGAVLSAKSGVAAAGAAETTKRGRVPAGELWAKIFPDGAVKNPQAGGTFVDEKSNYLIFKSDSPKTGPGDTHVTVDPNKGTDIFEMLKSMHRVANSEITDGPG